MIRALLFTVLSAAMLGACTQHDNGEYAQWSSYRHGGVGPSFSSRISGG